jgi:hypothetical protein
VNGARNANEINILAQDVRTSRQDTDMDVNVKNLKAVADRIELDGRFDLTTWTGWVDDSETRSRAPSIADVAWDCRTVACIAGWAAVIAYERGDVSGTNNASLIKRVALKFLGQSVAPIFMPAWHGWNDHYGRPTATQAAKRLRDIADDPKKWLT